MFDFMCENKGAVSIFLVIVMVPMLVLSGIFVDMSRITLAKSVAESSGELTLNTALTNYDAVLKDMYGLFATSQNTDELFENLENYYKQCIEAAGVAEADAEDYVAQIMQLIKSESGRDDLLNMNLTGFEVTKPTGGSLANPAILKSQIVEFMKYRGPINLGSGIFDALSSLKNVKKQSELVDNKNKFYEQQTSMMEDLESLWNDLEDYQYRDAFTWYQGDKCTFPDGDYLLESYERMKECIEPLQTSASYVARYLYFADSNYSVASSGTKDFGVTRNTSPSDEAYSEVWTVSQTDKQECAIKVEPESVSISKLQTALKSAYSAIQDLKNSNAVVEELSAGNANMSDTEKIKIVATFNASLGSVYHSRIKNLVSSLVHLKNTYAGCKDDVSKYYVIVNSNNTLSFTQDPEEEGAKPMAGFINGQLSHLSIGNNGHIDKYNALVQRINNFWNETVEIVKNARTYVTNSTKMAQSRASYFDSFLECKIKKLDSALTKISAIQSELTNTESEYNKALAAWKKSANGLSGETMGANDLSEIAKLEKVLTVDKVKALQTRVQSARDSLSAVKEQVAKFKVFGKEWTKLGVGSDGKVSINYNTLKNLLSSAQKNQISNVNKTKNLGTETINEAVTAKYDKAYDTVVNSFKAQVTSVEVKTDWASELSKSPNLIDDQVQLYTWLYSNFYDEASVKAKFDKNLQLETYTPPAETDTNSSSDISSNKGDADKSQTDLEGKANEYNDSEKKPTPSITAPNRVYDSNFLPSGEWKDTVLQVMEGNSDTSKNSDAMLSSSTNALGIFDGVLELVGDMATTLRDDLYICSYIMNMFSYSTYEAEITVKNGNDISAFASWYEWNATENKYTLRTDFSTKFSNSSQMLKDARTMTKVSINPNANYLYGGEVEYIIYGDCGTAKSYGTIYMIRFALNTVYAFMDAEIGNITTAAATAIFGTPPLTPLIPVAKIAMTIALALAESAYDLYQLKCGEAVPLMKNNSTWVMKPTNAAKAIAGEIVEEVADAAIDQGVKVLNDALNMTDEELKNLINSQKGEFDALVDATLDSTMNELKNYGNQAVQEMVNICNEVNSVAMETVGDVDKVALAKEKIKAWLDTQGSSENDIVFLAKKTAVDYLLDDDCKVIGDLFDKIESVGEQTAENIQNLGSDLEDILDDIQDKINTKIQQLSNQAGNALHDLRTKAISELKAAATEGAESLRSALKDKIGATFGTSGSATKGTSSVVSSLLSWRYSDYLQLFLLIGIVASPESILLRTADVIELNMQQIDGNPGFVEVTTETEVSRLWGLIKYTKTETKKEANDKAFKLSKSYTYLNVKATIEVKPMMLTIPLLADTVKSQLTGTNWYQIVYEGTMGY